MTDTFIEEVLVQRFLRMGEPFIKYIKDKNNNIVLDVDGYAKTTNVMLENKSFVRPKNLYWFEVFFVPATPFQSELGRHGRNRYTGFLQINVCVPLDVGKKALNDRYDKIATMFKRGDVDRGVGILKTERVSAQQYSDYYSQPIRVYWQADLDN